MLIQLQHASILTYIKRLEDVKKELEDNETSIHNLPFGSNYTTVSTGETADNLAELNGGLIDVSNEIIRIIQGTINYLQGLDREFTDLDNILNHHISNDIGVK